jgi:hypothetical protein
MLVGVVMRGVPEGRYNHYLFGQQVAKWARPSRSR